MKRLTDIWSSFPPQHKKRFYQALSAYALLTGGVAIWIGLHAKDTVRNWNSRIPSASTEIKNLYQSGTKPEVQPEITSSTYTDTTSPMSPPDTGAPAAPDGKTYISIIVSGLGLSSSITDKALDTLPSQVSLAFSPYSENIQDWIGKASSLHRESLILMPMETSTYPADDPGPRAISSRFSDQDNKDNLRWLLAQGKGSVGVVNLMGSRFLADQRRLSPVFDTLKKNNALFVETPGIPNSAGASVAAQTNLPYVTADLQIDAEVSDASIRRQLSSLEKIAQERGYAIGIAHAYPVSFNYIKSWAAGLEARGITLAPLRTVWKNKASHHEKSDQPPPQEQLQQP